MMMKRKMDNVMIDDSSTAVLYFTLFVNVFGIGIPVCTKMSHAH